MICNELEYCLPSRLVVLK